MFAPNRERLEPRWMHWLTPQFWAACDEKSQGTSGKNRIKPGQFRSIEIPVPPLPEQRRLVERIEELSVQLHEAHTLRDQAAGAAEALVRARLNELGGIRASGQDVLRSKPRKTAAELDALLPAILDRGFKGELLPPERIEASSPRRVALRSLHSFSREFIRCVFAAEIVDRMRVDSSFGQTNLHKICFLSEYRARVVELETHPTHHPCGPHDPAGPFQSS